jgi:hypothetical protein
MHDSEAGGMLVEVAITAVILVVMVAALTGVMRTGLSAHATGSALSELERDANVTVDRVATELVMSGPSVISPKPSTTDTVVTSITYQKNAGYSGGSAKWAATQSFELKADPTDADDGKDNNGNGIVDEKILVLVTDPGTPSERETVIARWVSELLEGEEANGLDDNGNGLIDEAGFCCTLDASVWTIRLTLQKPTSQGELLSRTVETSVTPRN